MFQKYELHRDKEMCIMSLSIWEIYVFLCAHKHLTVVVLYCGSHDDIRRAMYHCALSSRIYMNTYNAFTEKSGFPFHRNI